MKEVNSHLYLTEFLNNQVWKLEQNEEKFVIPLTNSQSQVFFQGQYLH